MLPILRILPVGGVLLAILILVLALHVPDGFHTPLSSTNVSARGALVDRDRHPEVRQFLILAALKRADELNRLRDLPDSPTRTDNPRVAGIPLDRSDADPDETASINETPAVSIPVEIGEPSSTELPMTLPEEPASTAKSPERAKPQRGIRRHVHRARHARVTQPQQLNFFELLFGGQQYRQPPNGSTQSGQQYRLPPNGSTQPGQQYRLPPNGSAQPGQQYQQPVYANQQPGQQSYQRYQQIPDIAAQANQSAFSTVPRTYPY
jgi:hypothetical protein